MAESMGTRNGPYEADYPKGTFVRVIASTELQKFKEEWRYHHPLQQEQLAFGGAVAKVVDVAYYHGGDELYSLEGIPGLWHEVCLRGANP
jgi:hypothetical protein